jgi:peptide/nickel transport system substrate-binding protein
MRAEIVSEDHFIICDQMKEGVMVKKCLSGNIFSISLVLLISGLFFVMGLAEAAEKGTQKTTTAVPKAVMKVTPTVQPQLGGILKIIEVTGPKTPFGWPPESVGESTVAGKPIIESLVRLHYDGRIEPWLAESWKIAPDKSSATFVLRKGIKFHDGTDFNAEAAKFNLDALKAGKSPGTEDWASIDVVDAYTVRINLLKYSNIFLSRLGGTPGSMVSPTAFKTEPCRDRPL